MKKTENIKNVLPGRLKKIADSGELTRQTSGIRIRTGYPVILAGESESIPFPGEIAEKEDLTELVAAATENSLYAYIDEIRNGYITIKGGHRLGLCGRAVYEDEKLKNIKDFSCVNIRISRQITGVSDSIINRIAGEGIKSTLIISPPGGGKTTLLRDIARNLGNMPGMRPALIDSRCEIGAEFNGRAYNDIGKRTFLLSGYRKKEGFDHAVRALSPNVILCDEIGNGEDAKMIFEAACCGVGVIATAHGGSIEEICNKKEFGELIGRIFDYAVFPDKKTGPRIVKL